MIKCQLKTILKTLNLTQKDLCELINARPSTICSLCNNTFDSALSIDVTQKE